MNEPVQPRWLVALKGHPIDLERWETDLKPPYDPACERHVIAGESVLCLHSRLFQRFHAAEQVLPKAEQVVALVNGAIRAKHGGGPVVLWAIGQLDALGLPRMTQFAHVDETLRAHETVAVFLNGTAEQGDAEIVYPPVAPLESVSQRWLTAAITDERVAQLLSLGGKADNWIDIYKAYEAAKRLTGGQDKLHALLGNEASRAELLRRTANTHRHADAPPVPKPMEINEAIVLIGRLLVAAMKDAGL
jgi:hypothetical protein